jgi:hypothetical protein
MGSSQSSLALKIDISGKGVKDIEKDLKQPHMLPAFPKLEQINLSKNKITSVPDSIFADIQKSPKVIEHLQVLNFSKNKLATIPDAIWLLVNIRELDLSSNEIVHINDKILTFYRLSLFNISYNKIKKIPWGIHRLHALRAFYLDHNEIIFLPNSISKMKVLEEFTYRPNPLDESYEKFGGVEELLSVFRHLKRQKIPSEFKDEARHDREKSKDKREKLSADGRIVKALLSYQEGLEGLGSHMKKEFSYENLSFYREVRDFRKKYNSSVEIRTTELIADAKKVFEDFVSDTGSRQVNLPAEVIQSLKKTFTDTFNFPRGINQWIFDDAYKASFDLMVRDTFSRFRVTPNGKDLIEQLKRIEGDKLKLPDA